MYYPPHDHPQGWYYPLPQHGNPQSCGYLQRYAYLAGVLLQRFVSKVATELLVNVIIEGIVDNNGN
jgi:hypothetical protein